MVLELLPQSLDVSRHLACSLAPDHEWHQELSDPVTNEVQVDPQTRTLVADGFDRHLDNRSDRAVYPTVSPATRRIVLGDLGRYVTLATPDLPRRGASGTKPCRPRVELSSQTTLLPLRHMTRIRDVGENLFSRSRHFHGARDRCHHCVPGVAGDRRKPANTIAAPYPWNMRETRPLERRPGIAHGVEHHQRY